MTTQTIAEGEELLLQYGEGFFKQQQETIVGQIRKYLEAWQMRQSLIRANTDATRELLEVIDQVPSPLLHLFHHLQLCLLNQSLPPMVPAPRPAAAVLSVQ